MRKVCLCISILILVVTIILSNYVYFAARHVDFFPVYNSYSYFYQSFQSILVFLFSILFTVGIHGEIKIKRAVGITLGVLFFLLSIHSLIIYIPLLSRVTITDIGYLYYNDKFGNLEPVFAYLAGLFIASSIQKQTNS